ncbi:MAG: UDP-N-acetylmuramoyl-L-alanine--D-glutamate ligase [Lentimicrobium sp.]|jgi:UDP-N-acetylmuramoylalanine--D-glutamate ligase|nr:UDP-N-acetylmuramoyl-L-alanine--D-glutamate ligase [Lentimicrobium sp.]
MKALLEQLLNQKSIVILGYGREGQSTYALLRKYFSQLNLTIADSDESIIHRHPELNSSTVNLQTGAGYLNNLNDYDVIIKSPGISLTKTDLRPDAKKITSQTDLFLRTFSPQIIGVTGTKGKSTTASLLHHICQKQSSDVVLLGNIGVPFFDALENLSSQTRILCELSSHQLEYLTVAPHLSILTNIFEEHLDHYESYEAYQWAKFQIALKQMPGDYFLYNPEDERIDALLKNNTIPGIPVPVNLKTFEDDGAGVLNNELIIRLKQKTQEIIPSGPTTRLLGEHNLRNIYLAAVTAHLSGISPANILEGIADFQPLEHRLEYCETSGKAHFYNDSISTIPEAALAAIATLKNVHTLIAGGFDRGIDYENFADVLINLSLKYILLTGPAGQRINDLIAGKKQYKAVIQHFDHFDDAVKKAIKFTPAGEICLLSPAASSYDQFANFEERGRRFKQLVKQD